MTDQNTGDTELAARQANERHQRRLNADRKHLEERRKPARAMATAARAVLYITGFLTGWEALAVILFVLCRLFAWVLNFWPAGSMGLTRAGGMCVRFSAITVISGILHNGPTNFFMMVALILGIPWLIGLILTLVTGIMLGSARRSVPSNSPALKLKSRVEVANRINILLLFAIIMGAIVSVVLLILLR